MANAVKRFCSELQHDDAGDDGTTDSKDPGLGPVAEENVCDQKDGLKIKARWKLMSKCGIIIGPLTFRTAGHRALAKERQEGRKEVFLGYSLSLSLLESHPPDALLFSALACFSTPAPFSPPPPGVGY